MNSVIQRAPPTVHIHRNGAPQQTEPPIVDYHRHHTQDVAAGFATSELQNEARQAAIHQQLRQHQQLSDMTTSVSESETQSGVTGTTTSTSYVTGASSSLSTAQQQPQQQQQQPRRGSAAQTTNTTNSHNTNKKHKTTSSAASSTSATSGTGSSSHQQKTPDNPELVIEAPSGQASEIGALSPIHPVGGGGSYNKSKKHPSTPISANANANTNANNGARNPSRTTAPPASAGSSRSSVASSGIIGDDADDGGAAAQQQHQQQQLQAFQQPGGAPFVAFGGGAGQQPPPGGGGLTASMISQNQQIQQMTEQMHRLAHERDLYRSECENLRHRCHELSFLYDQSRNDHSSTQQQLRELKEKIANAVSAEAVQRAQEQTWSNRLGQDESELNVKALKEELAIVRRANQQQQIECPPSNDPYVNMNRKHEAELRKLTERMNSDARITAAMRSDMKHVVSLYYYGLQQLELAVEAAAEGAHYPPAFAPEFARLVQDPQIMALAEAATSFGFFDIPLEATNVKTDYGVTKLEGLAKNMPKPSQFSVGVGHDVAFQQRHGASRTNSNMAGAASSSSSPSPAAAGRSSAGVAPGGSPSSPRRAGGGPNTMLDLSAASAGSGVGGGGFGRCDPIAAMRGAQPPPLGCAQTVSSYVQHVRSVIDRCFGKVSANVISVGQEASAIRDVLSSAAAVVVDEIRLMLLPQNLFTKDFVKQLQCTTNRAFKEVESAIERMEKPDSDIDSDDDYGVDVSKVRVMPESVIRMQQAARDASSATSQMMAMMMSSSDGGGGGRNSPMDPRMAASLVGDTLNDSRHSHRASVFSGSASHHSHHHPVVYPQHMVDTPSAAAGSPPQPTPHPGRARSVSMASRKSHKSSASKLSSSTRHHHHHHDSTSDMLSQQQQMMAGSTGGGGGSGRTSPHPSGAASSGGRPTSPLDAKIEREYQTLLQMTQAISPPRTAHGGESAKLHGTRESLLHVTSTLTNMCQLLQNNLKATENNRAVVDRLLNEFYAQVKGMVKVPKRMESAPSSTNSSDAGGGNGDVGEKEG